MRQISPECRLRSGLRVPVRKQVLSPNGTYAQSCVVPAASCSSGRCHAVWYGMWLRQLSFLHVSFAGRPEDGPQRYSRPGTSNAKPGKSHSTLDQVFESGVGGSLPSAADSDTHTGTAAGELCIGAAGSTVPHNRLCRSASMKPRDSWPIAWTGWQLSDGGRAV